MEIWFYHLTREPLESALPKLLERSLERGWRAVVQARDEERLAAIDNLLWTWSDESFLAHGVARDGDAAMQPIFLTTGEETPNGARVRFFVGGADIAPAFDGADPEALQAARAQWKLLKEQGRALSYWQQGDSGGWEKKA